MVDAGRCVSPHSRRSSMVAVRDSHQQAGPSRGATSRALCMIHAMYCPFAPAFKGGIDQHGGCMQYHYRPGTVSEYISELLAKHAKSRRSERSWDAPAPGPWDALTAWQPDGRAKPL